MKVHVDPDRCQGHTLCSMIAPAAFELDDVDGHSTATISGDVPAELEAKVREAARSCPEQAIIISGSRPTGSWRRREWPGPEAASPAAG